MLAIFAAVLKRLRTGGLGASGAPIRISPAHSISGCVPRLTTRDVEPVRWVVRMTARILAESRRCDISLSRELMST